MIIYNTKSGILIFSNEEYFLVENINWEQFINDDNLYKKCTALTKILKPTISGEELLEKEILKPITDQEIWAAGVTYFNSKMARQEESAEAGGGDFYAKVYTAERPELFFKSSGKRAVGHMDYVSIRKDSEWNVPEPELTLFVSSSSKIIGYTIGNDMSSRSIEGENPLYLPQAKSYNRSAAIGPGILLTNNKFSRESSISMSIKRAGKQVFNGQTKVSNMVRDFEELVAYLFREMDFPQGCFLMTGTGIIPPASFTLNIGDLINIEIEGIGELINEVR